MDDLFREMENHLQINGVDLKQMRNVIRPNFFLTAHRIRNCAGMAFVMPYLDLSYSFNSSWFCVLVLNW